MPFAALIAWTLRIAHYILWGALSHDATNRADNAKNHDYCHDSSDHESDVDADADVHEMLFAGSRHCSPATYGDGHASR